MSEWTIKKGNTAVQDILIKDADGDRGGFSGKDRRCWD